MFAGAELIDILEVEKAPKISQATADTLFHDWKMKHELGGQAKSFREKQVTA